MAEPIPAIQPIPQQRAAAHIEAMEHGATDMTDTPFAALSDAIETAVAAAAPLVAAVTWARHGQVSGILLRPGVLATSEQSLGDADAYEATLPGGARVAATLAGRDPATNVAVLRLESAPPGWVAGEPRGLGGLVLAIGSDGDGGATARMGGIEVIGPAWESQRGGKIDRLMRIGVRLPPAAEGGPVVDSRGAVLGMSTFGPRRGVMVIPTSTVGTDDRRHHERGYGGRHRGVENAAKQGGRVMHASDSVRRDARLPEKVARDGNVSGVRDVSRPARYSRILSHVPSAVVIAVA